MADKKLTPFEKVGGRALIAKVSKVFYDKVYKDPWLGKYFDGIPQEHIENQQTDFMQGALRGEKIYSGRLPKEAHEHMVITDELFEYRNQLLLESLKECGVSEEMQTVWINVDEAFRNVIVKGTNEAKKRYTTDVILNFKKPNSAA